MFSQDIMQLSIGYIFGSAGLGITGRLNGAALDASD
jgi:hypothetical protein